MIKNTNRSLESVNALPRRTRIKKQITPQTLRRISQIGFGAFIAYLVIRNGIAGEDVSGATPSAEAFCPFGGLETLYKYISSGGSFVSHTHLSNLVMLIAVLVIALLFRSAFCGWICPLGALQDLINRFSLFLQKMIPGLNRADNFLKKNGASLRGIDRYLRLLKYFVLIWAIGGSAYFGYMVFRDFDPWSTLLSMFEYSFTPGVIVLSITLLASLFVERPWCRYACPLGAVSGLVGKFSPMSVTRNAKTCISCKLCTKACPMGLKVHDTGMVKNVDCISCLECIDACPVEGTLQMKANLPFTGK